MIDAQEAHKKALEFYKKTTGQLDVKCTLEEVEKVDGYWNITLGFGSAPNNPLFAMIKEYKIFRVNAKTGEVDSMKMRR